MQTQISFDNRVYLTISQNDESDPNDVRVEVGDQSFHVTVSQNDAGQYAAAISQDGWAWDGNNMDYPTADEAMNAALGDIADTVTEHD